MSLPRIFCLTVDRPIACFEATAKHLDERGIKWERLNGFDNQRCKLSPVLTFDLDRVGEKIGSKHICATLTHYLCWFLMSYQPDDHFIVFEYDVVIPPDFEKQYEAVMAALPNDWQICFLGSCCCEGRETKQIKDNIYEVKYPLCGHAIMYRKSALPVLLREHQAIYEPLDIALFHHSLPQLRTYCVLPPLVTQSGLQLPP